MADVPLTTHGGGRKQSLTHGEALVAAEALQRGLSEEQSAFVVSGWRAEKGKPPVSRSAVRTAFGNIDGVERPRGTRHQGSTDPDSAWAQSRVPMVEQFLEQLQPATAATTRVRRDGSARPDKVALAQIGWSDETHSKVVMGDDASTKERVLPQSPGGSYCPLADGGQYPPPNEKLIVKDEADGGRMLCGVMMKVDAVGELEGHKFAELFDYSGTHVVGPTTFQDRFDAEIARVKELEGVWAKHKVTGPTKALPGGRYQLTAR